MSTRFQDVSIYVEQKLVDTMLVCDVVGLSTLKEVRCILVVSDDTDILPGIAMAAVMGSSTIALHKTQRRSVDYYDAAITDLGVILQTVG